jgi:L-serine deaminase
MYHKGHEFVQHKLGVVCTNTFISVMCSNVSFIFVLKEHIDQPSHATVSVTSNTCHNTVTALKVKCLSRTLWRICTAL